MWVLEIGCGTGNYGLLVSERTGASVFGVDPSWGMLVRGRERPIGQVTFIQARAEELPFRDQSFDFLFSIDVVHHLQKRRGMFAEALRVLKAGGVLCTVTESHDQLRRRFMATYFPSVTRANLARFSDVPQLVNWMRLVGFQDLEAEAFVSYEHVTPEYVEALRSKEYSVLEFVPHEEFIVGLEKLRGDLARCALVREEWHTFVWGRR